MSATRSMRDALQAVDKAAVKASSLSHRSQSTSLCLLEGFTSK